MLSYNQFGLPLQIFHSKCLFLPIFSLNELDLFEKSHGYLAGTTNQLFLNFPKAKADLVINVDKDQIIMPSEKQMSNKLKQASKHTMAEKVFLANLVQKVSQLEDQVGEGNLRVSGDESV